jgi:hypothetical protein
MAYRNYAIKGSKGVFYESSKEHQIGFDIKYETQKKEIRYHRESPVLEGVLSRLQLRESEFNNAKVKSLRIWIKEDNGDMGILSIPLLTMKGGLDPWVKSFMLYLPVLKKDQEIKISLNRKDKDKAGYLYKTVWIRDQDDELVPWAFDPRKEAGVVPEPSKTTHTLTGEEKWDFSQVDKWYYDYLMKVMEQWGGLETEGGQSRLGNNEEYVGNPEAARRREELKNRPAINPNAVPPPGASPNTGTAPPPAYDDVPF